MIDISMPIHAEMTVYKNKENKKVKVTIDSDFESGTSHETRLSINLHSGTHIDAPLHMIPGGDTTEVYPLDTFVGDCKVVDMKDIDVITKENLEGLKIEEDDFILFKTRNSKRDDFDPEFVYVDASAAQFLADCHVRGVGIDALGIERAQPNHETHTILLNNGIVILEGLRLGHVDAGIYSLIALPLAIQGVDASLVRAVLIP